MLKLHVVKSSLYLNRDILKNSQTLPCIWATFVTKSFATASKSSFIWSHCVHQPHIREAREHFKIENYFCIFPTGSGSSGILYEPEASLGRSGCSGDLDSEYSGLHTVHDEGRFSQMLLRHAASQVVKLLNML